MSKKISYTRSRWQVFQNCQYITVFDDHTDVEPGKCCEVADLFKQLDESGEVHNFQYSDNLPMSLHPGDFAENETTYQGAYERWLYGEPPQGDSQTSASSEAQTASAAEPPQGEQQQSS